MGKKPQCAMAELLDEYEVEIPKSMKTRKQYYYSNTVGIKEHLLLDEEFIEMVQKQTRLINISTYNIKCINKYKPKGKSKFHTVFFLKLHQKLWNAY